MVLTAGLGTRLDPLTRLVAKPALPVGATSLIEIILRWLAHEGVRRTVLNLHHLPHSIAARVGDGSHVGLEVRYSWEHPLLGSAGGPRHALPLLSSENFIIVNGDTLCELDLSELIDAHERSGADATLAVIPNSTPDHYNGLRLDAADRIVGWEPRGRAEGTWHFVGVQVVRARVFAGLADGVAAETVSGIYRDLMADASRRLQGWRVSGPFVDIGTPRDYLRTALARTSVQDRRPARLRTCVIWPEAIVDEGVELEECVVAGPVRVPRGVKARASVIVPSRVVRDGDRVEVRDGLAFFPLTRESLARAVP
jgi:NDP-sugar pyrophosphorylase family protein